jgi:hypothetical protein
MKAGPLLAALNALVLLTVLANAQERPCKNNDDCDRLAFERAEKEIGEAVPRALAFIDHFATAETRETAKSELRRRNGIVSFSAMRPAGLRPQPFIFEARAQRRDIPRPAGAR